MRLRRREMDRRGGCRRRVFPNFLGVSWRRRRPGRFLGLQPSGLGRLTGKRRLQLLRRLRQIGDGLIRRMFRRQRRRCRPRRRPHFPQSRLNRINQAGNV